MTPPTAPPSRIGRPGKQPPLHISLRLPTRPSIDSLTRLKKEKKNNLLCVRDALTWSSRSHRFFTDRSVAIVFTNIDFHFKCSAIVNPLFYILDCRKFCTSPPSQWIESKEPSSPCAQLYLWGWRHRTMDILKSNEGITGAAMLFFLPKVPTLP